MEEEQLPPYRGRIAPGWFKTIDTNSDNFLSAEEIQVFMRNQTATAEYTDEEVKLAAEYQKQQADLDGNNKLSEGELALDYNKGQPIDRQDFERKHGVEAANKLFDKYDTNKGGVITSDEVKAHDIFVEQNVQKIGSVDYSSEKLQVFDTNNDTRLSQEELQTHIKNTYGLSDEGAKFAAETMIKDVDVNGDNHISAGEWALANNNGQQLNRQDFENKYGADEANKMFDKYDADKNGIITSNEIATYDKAFDYKMEMLNANGVTGGAAYSYERFKIMDTNKDNFISQKELQTYLTSKSNGSLSKEGVQLAANMTIKEADINGDNKMSLGEWALANANAQQINRQDFEAKYGANEANKFFNEYDKNKDGTVTKDEIRDRDKELDKSKGLSAGAIAGIIALGVTVLGLVAVGLYFLLRKKKGKNEQHEYNYEYEQKSVDNNVNKSLNTVNEQKQDKSRSVA